MGRRKGHAQPRRAGSYRRRADGRHQEAFVFQHARSIQGLHGVADHGGLLRGEAEGLARAIHLEIAATALVSLNDIRPATYLGKGKVEEFAEVIRENDIAIVSMDCQLSPVQQRNLERAWDAKVIDRTGLILEIFGERARTREGSLQVELAHLAYQKSRLVRSWTHLERQRGGFGGAGRSHGQ